MQKQNVRTIVSILFVVSGIAGLIYQVVWFKYLSLFLGNTTYAQMTVLATFLGGLAFGNYLFGKRSDSITNPVRVYSLLELFIGVYCLLYPTINSLVGNLFLSTASNLDLISKPFLFTGTRFLVAAIILFLPATAMGGTLPVLSNFFVERIQDARKEIASLYFLNSFGAVVGVVFAGFVLIKEFGLDITIYSTAFLNIFAGLVGFYLSRKQNKLLELELVPEDDTNYKDFFEVDKQTVKSVILVAGISGMAALLYEMVWVRLLINFFGSSTYAFSIMLMAFIGGITLGSLVVSQNVLKKYNYIKLLTFLQCAIAFSTMFVLLFYERLPYLLWKVSALFSKSQESFEIFLAVEFILCFCLILLPTLFMGMSLPVASEIVSASYKKIGVSVGRVFSVNTIGAVVGVVLTGLIFIPLFGIKITFEIGVALNLFGVFLLLSKYKSFSAKEKVLFYSICSFAFCSYLVFSPKWNEKVLLSGVFRSFGAPPPSSFDEFTKGFNDEEIIFYKEGINATVAVTQSLQNKTNKRLIINGKPDASTYFDMPTQVLLGEIPMMLHPDPKNIFVVGFGSGTTIGSVLNSPVEKVICAEISKEVISAASLFERENKNCINDPRVNILNEDAVTLLKLSKDKYDVIISEPSNPWVAGIGNLFSKEYFEKCSASLAEGGIMIQWFHLYEADDDVVKLVLNTFSSVFPYSQLWGGTANDIILVGSKKEIVVSLEGINNKFASPLIKQDFERIGINNPFAFFACQSVSPRGFFTMANNSPINSEIHPRLEFLAPRAFFVGKQSSYIYSFDEKFDTLSSGLYIKEYVKKYPPQKNVLLNTIDYALNISKNYRFAFGLSKYLKELFPNDYQTNLLYSLAYEKLGIINARLSSLERLVNLFPDSLQIKKDYNNIILNEKINASTFLQIFSIENESKSFIGTTKPDSISRLSVYIQLAKAFLQNSEILNAEEMLAFSENYLKRSPSLIKSVKADVFYYVGAMINLYKKEYEKVFGYYLALMNHNPNYENLFRLRKLVSWHLKMER
ncbi:MAG: fused MFS/spermidine synthase [Melioribacteraceae bacterium]